MESGIYIVYPVVVGKYREKVRLDTRARNPKTSGVLLRTINGNVPP